MLSLPNPLLLASQSPRRIEILKMAGFAFRTTVSPYEEKLPDSIDNPDDIPAYLAEQKAMHVTDREEGEIVLSADTLVFLDDEIIGKPKDREDAFQMLQKLSGKTHKVITGVCLLTEGDKILFSDTTLVQFKAFEMRELEYYIEHYNVLDKAGSYGAQDWLGLIGVERIEGSYFNVMGLPIHRVYEGLKVIANH
jgi:septum formation protein